MTTVLKEIAEEEIDEVDIIMEDISEEIKDLQDSISVDDQKKTIVSSNSGTNLSAMDYNSDIHTSQQHVSMAKLDEIVHLYNIHINKLIFCPFYLFHSIKMASLSLTTMPLEMQV